jgi:hypothetical protein
MVKAWSQYSKTLYILHQCSGQKLECLDLESISKLVYHIGEKLEPTKSEHHIVPLLYRHGLILTSNIRLF